MQGMMHQTMKSSISSQIEFLLNMAYQQAKDLFPFWVHCNLGLKDSLKIQSHLLSKTKAKIMQTWLILERQSKSYNLLYINYQEPYIPKWYDRIKGLSTMILAMLSWLYIAGLQWYLLPSFLVLFILGMVATQALLYGRPLLA